MTKDELIALARENDVKIDVSQKKAEIEAVLLEAGLIEPAEDDVKTTPLLLLRDAWDDNGERQPANTVANFSFDTARALIKAGVAERADPFPGEE